MAKEIKGVLPVILMPYTDALDIDEADFGREVDHIFGAGCDGFVIGQVSEVMRLTTPERYRLAELCAETANGRGPTIVSTGAESTKAAVDYSRQAQSAGVDAVLLMHPATTALSAEDMYRYYADVIEAIDIPVVVHHAKSYAKVPLAVETQARLLQEYGADRVLYKPEASPTPPRVSQIRELTGGKARIFEGDGGMMLLDCYKRGLAGSIPAADCAEISVALWRALTSGDDATARRIGHPLAYLMCHMMNSVDCYQAIGKHFLKRRGIIRNDHVRGPVDYRPDRETIAEVEQTYEYLMSLVKEAA